MPFCATCGAQVEGRFCAKCGSPAAAGAAPMGGGMGGAAPQPMAPPPMAASAGLQDNVAAALCYVLGLITGILFLVIPPYNQNRTIRFHAFQAIFMHVGSIMLWIVVLVLSSFSHLVGFLISPLVGLGLLGLWLYLIVMAYQGKTVVLPIIGPIAQQQA